jgi:hypothetical protein
MSLRAYLHNSHFEALTYAETPAQATRNVLAAA